MKPRHPARRTALVLALAFWLAGCAGTTEILRSVPEATPSKPLRSLFVAGVTTDDDLRRRYESMFVAELARAGVSGTPSHSELPDTRGLDVAQFRARMHAAGSKADGVLHVQLVEFTRSPALSPQDLPADQSGASRELNGIALTLNAPPGGPVTGTHDEVVLQATLYELPSRKLLWTVTTRTHEANDIDSVAQSHARALVTAMREAGYLAPHTPGKP